MKVPLIFFLKNIEAYVFCFATNLDEVMHQSPILKISVYLYFPYVEIEFGLM